MQASKGYGRYAAIATNFAIVKGTRFAKANPMLCKAVPTSIGFAFGDFLTQYMNRDTEQPFKMQFDKTAKMAVVGATIAGPLGLLALQRLSLAMPLAAAVIGSEASWGSFYAVPRLNGFCTFLELACCDRAALPQALNLQLYYTAGSGLSHLAAGLLLHLPSIQGRRSSARQQREAEDAAAAGHGSSTLG